MPKIRLQHHRKALSTSGFVYKKRNYFDKLNLAVWFIQLVVSFVVALS